VDREASKGGACAHDRQSRSSPPVKSTSREDSVVVRGADVPRSRTDESETHPVVKRKMTEDNKVSR
jgi:hypothetical protein